MREASSADGPEKAKFPNQSQWTRTRGPWSHRAIVAGRSSGGKFYVNAAAAFGHNSVMLTRRLTPSEIARRLREASAGQTADELPGLHAEAARPAAVLLPLFEQGAEWHLLYIVRAEHDGDRHSGEVAFPGGRRERDDADAVATALREAREEVGLDPGRVRILGVLPPLRTVSGYRVTPVVGHIPWPLPLRPDPAEVARVFGLPLPWLGDPVNRRVRVWPAPDHPEAREVIFFEERDGQRLWGVSARITLDLLRCLQLGADA
jgi:8-oxo-dGTP pyrophosphatase MutT (NUDIX family)